MRILYIAITTQATLIGQHNYNRIIDDTINEASISKESTLSITFHQEILPDADLPKQAKRSCLNLISIAKTDYVPLKRIIDDMTGFGRGGSPG